MEGYGCTDGEAALWLAALPLHNSEHREQAECVTFRVYVTVAVACVCWDNDAPCHPAQGVI